MMAEGQEGIPALEVMAFLIQKWGVGTWGRMCFLVTRFPLVSRSGQESKPDR